MPFLSALPTVDPQSVVDGAALWNNGFKNYLINGDFAINQRGFAGGALAAGVYGFDRWKAGTGGCSVSLTSGVLTHTSGPMIQVIEAPNLAGKTVSVSVEDLTGGNLTASIDGVSGVIVAGAGRVGVAIAVPAGSTGNVTLTLTPVSGAVTYKRVQIEMGSVATAFEFRPPAAEIDLCVNYFRVIGSGTGFASSSVRFTFGLMFRRMRSVPALSQIPGVLLSVTTTFADYLQSAPSLISGTVNADGLHASCENFTGLTAGSSYVMHALAGPFFFLDAEL